MKKSRLLLMALFSLLVPVAGVFADHNDHNDHDGGVIFGTSSVALLQQQTAQLNQQVQYSGLRYEVVSAVSQFKYAVDSLASCNGLRPIYNDHNDHNDPGSMNPACAYLLSSVQMSFSSVQRYLSDAYEYRSVYGLYQSVSATLSSLGGGYYPPTPPTPYPPRPYPPTPYPPYPYPPTPYPPIPDHYHYQCTAVSTRGWISRSYVGEMSESQVRARSSALRACEMNSSGCVIQSCRTF